MNERSVKIKTRFFYFQIFFFSILKILSFSNFRFSKYPLSNKLKNRNHILMKDFLSLSVVLKTNLQWQVSSFYWG
jgi:hypothetical protein